MGILDLILLITYLIGMIFSLCQTVRYKTSNVVVFTLALLFGLLFNRVSSEYLIHLQIGNEAIPQVASKLIEMDDTTLVLVNADNYKENLHQTFTSWHVPLGVQEDLVKHMTITEGKLADVISSGIVGILKNISISLILILLLFIFFKVMIGRYKRKLINDNQDNLKLLFINSIGCTSKFISILMLISLMMRWISNQSEQLNQFLTNYLLDLSHVLQILYLFSNYLLN